MTEIKVNTDIVFKEILNCKTVDELNEIRPEFLEKYFINTNKYPEIKFKISKKEIENLGGIDLSLSKKIDDKNLSPLEKLLLSILWKNGDLGKEKHILEGILNTKSIENKSSGLVFYQFGKRLENPDEQPIIDQHIIRAYLFNLESRKEELITISGKKELSNKDSKIIQNYIDWVNMTANRIHGENHKILYEIDKILFALGKYIKKHKTTNNGQR